jgi:23S rRNA pseudouridine1911/1915/1917 synthase
MPRLRVEEPGALLPFLVAHLRGWKRSTVKDRLRRGAVLVNGAPFTRHDHPLAAGDEVEVQVAGAVSAPRPAPGGLRVLHLDEALVAVDKPAGLLSVATNNERERTALQRTRDHLRSIHGAGASRLWAAHRLDRETSGVLLFARSFEVKQALRAGWPQVRKRYLAIVHGLLEPEEGVVDRPLVERGDLKVYVDASHPEARDAVTRFRRVGERADRSRVEIDLETGRKHQIRVHMASLGHPLVGDTRYGGERWRSRIALHAARLELTHPTTGEPLTIESPPPAVFDALVPSPSP